MSLAVEPVASSKGHQALIPAGGATQGQGKSGQAGGGSPIPIESIAPLDQLLTVE
jgi:hypothetical protein